jgi:uncharacterized protein YcbK (DUF882 family)
MIPKPEFIAALQTLRDVAGFPFPITSCARCVKHNRDEGGKEHSKHTLGIAADIGVTGSRRFDLVKLAMIHGFNGIGIANEFIHLDTRSLEERAVWDYA